MTTPKWLCNMCKAVVSNRRQHLVREHPDHIWKGRIELQNYFTKPDGLLTVKSIVNELAGGLRKRIDQD